MEGEFFVALEALEASTLDGDKRSDFQFKKKSWLTFQLLSSKKVDQKILLGF